MRRPQNTLSLSSVGSSYRTEGECRNIRVLFAAFKELGATPTACGSPFARSGEAGNPSPSDVCTHNCDCLKKKFGKPTCTRPENPCTFGSNRTPLAVWNAFGGVNISESLKKGSSPSHVQDESLFKAPQTSYCSFSARGWRR